MIALRELLEKGSDATLLREMIGFAAQRLMELEAETAAGHGERSESRTDLRNGYRDRDWHTRVGTRCNRSSLLAPSPQFEMASLTGVPAGRSLRWVALSPCGYDARVVSSSAIAYRPSSKHDPGFLLEEASGRQTAKGCAPCSAPFGDTRSHKALSKS
jgi:hypothetical protein